MSGIFDAELEQFKDSNRVCGSLRYSPTSARKIRSRA